MISRISCGRLKKAMVMLSDVAEANMFKALFREWRFSNVGFWCG